MVNMSTLSLRNTETGGTRTTCACRVRLFYVECVLFDLVRMCSLRQVGLAPCAPAVFATKQVSCHKSLAMAQDPPGPFSAPCIQGVLSLSLSLSLSHTHTHTPAHTHAHSSTLTHTLTHPHTHTHQGHAHLDRRHNGLHGEAEAADSKEMDISGAQISRR